MKQSRPANQSPIAADDDIRALIEDIDASLEDFDKRLELERRRQNQVPSRFEPPRVAMPALPAEPARIEPSLAEREPPVVQEAASEATATSLLEQLAQEASRKAGVQALTAADREQRARRIHVALGRISQYFEEFCRYVSMLTPEVPRTYRLDQNVGYAGLSLREARVKARKDSLSEVALLDFVGLHLRLAAKAPITVHVRTDRLAAFKKDLHVLDLRIAEGMELDGIPDPTGMTFRLSPDLPVQLTFGANIDEDRIDILSRNLEGFGISAFLLAPEDVDRALLDGIGSFLLARTTTLPPQMRRAHYRDQL